MAKRSSFRSRLASATRAYHVWQTKHANEAPSFPAARITSEGLRRFGIDPAAFADWPAPVETRCDDGMKIWDTRDVCACLERMGGHADVIQLLTPRLSGSGPRFAPPPFIPAEEESTEKRQRAAAFRPVLEEITEEQRRDLWNAERLLERLGWSPAVARHPRFPRPFSYTPDGQPLHVAAQVVHFTNWLTRQPIASKPPKPRVPREYGHTRLTPEKRERILGIAAASGTLAAIGARFGCSESYASAIRNGAQYSDITGIVRRAEDQRFRPKRNPAAGGQDAVVGL